MIELLLDSLVRYYGLDWMSFMFGFTGNICITRKMKIGFLMVATACFCGFLIALLSSQFGFVVANLLYVTIMVKGYMDWTREPIMSHSE